MGIAKSRMKKVAPVSVTDENVSGGLRYGNPLFGPSNIKPVRRSAQANCNSEGLDSEFSAEDLAVEVDRILDECDNTSELYYVRRQDSNKNEVNKQTSIIHETVRPTRDLMNCANMENTATALGYGMGGGSSQSFPVVYDASEEDLMNTIERDFG